jgi:16S rRNA (cytosine1402-N4)-methyltransferase
MIYQHTPVMLKEIIEYLNPRPGQNFIDCTLGGAGYTMAIAGLVGQKGKVLAIDLDKMAIENAKCKMQNAKLRNIILINDNFKNLSKIVQDLTPALSLSRRGSDGHVEFHGIVLDLGLSSAQLQDRNRGFSFQLDAPLNMAFGQTAGETTERIVNNWRAEELERIFKEYGEERFAKRIARKIVEYRKLKSIKTTGQMVEIIKSAMPKKYLYAKIHPATRVFQALRIATNKELENLEQVLPQAMDLLAPKGRIAVVSYHSLEDRIVKRFFRQESKDCICPPSYPACRCHHKARLKILTPRVVRASEEEVLNNPRARSAKLRAAERI